MGPGRRESDPDCPLGPPPGLTTDGYQPPLSFRVSVAVEETPIRTTVLRTPGRREGVRTEWGRSQNGNCQSQWRERGRGCAPWCRAVCMNGRRRTACLNSQSQKSNESWILLTVRVYGSRPPPHVRTETLVPSTLRPDPIDSVRGRRVILRSTPPFSGFQRTGSVTDTRHVSSDMVVSPVGHTDSYNVGSASGHPTPVHPRVHGLLPLRTDP